MLSEKQKYQIKKELVSCLSSFEEVQKIVIFGSFITSDDPHDIDVAVFQKSGEKYLPLAMKYRRQTRAIAERIPLDIFPVRNDVEGHFFISDIESGEVVYER